VKTPTRKAPVIWCVEDYEPFRRQFGEFVAIWFPSAKFEAFSDAMAMSKEVGSPDIILLDVAGMTGGVTPGSGVGIEAFSRLAEGVIREHPGAVVGMYSAVGGWAKEVVADLKAALPESVIEQFDGMDSSDLKRFLETHLAL
jgi:hypothetical protein